MISGLCALRVGGNSECRLLNLGGLRYRVGTIVGAVSWLRQSKCLWTWGLCLNAILLTRGVNAVSLTLYWTVLFIVVLIGLLLVVNLRMSPWVRMINSLVDPINDWPLLTTVAVEALKNLVYAVGPLCT